MNTAANWNPSTRSSITSALTFPNVSSQRYAVTFSTFTLNSMTISSTVGYTISGSQPLRFANSVVDTISLQTTGNQFGTATFDAPVQFLSSTTVAASGATITMNNNVTYPTSGTVHLNDALTRTVAMTGGMTFPLGSQLRIAQGQISLRPTSVSTVGAGPFIRITGGTTTWDSDVVMPRTDLSSGTLVIQRPNTLGNNLLQTGGTLILQSSQSTQSLSMSAGTISGARGVALSRSTGVTILANTGSAASTTGEVVLFNVNSTLSGATTLEFNGGTPVGTGGTLTLVGGNTGLVSIGSARTYPGRVLVGSTASMARTGTLPLTIAELDNTGFTTLSAPTTIQAGVNTGTITTFSQLTTLGFSNFGEVVPGNGSTSDLGGFLQQRQRSGRFLRALGKRLSQERRSAADPPSSPSPSWTTIPPPTAGSH